MSLLWRYRWEDSDQDIWRRKLITYNQEDCAALRAVTEYLRRSGAPETSGPPIVQVQELDRLAYAPKWSATRFGNEDFEAINSRAHFDYQQQRVFVRTNKRLKKRLRKPGVHRNRLLRVTKRIEVTARRCPACTSGRGYCGILVGLLAAWAIAQSFRKKDSPFSDFQKKLIWFWLAVLVFS